ncbi:MAG: hypothetical protein WA020_03890 [Candidatus Acidiferrales bacterium]
MRGIAVAALFVLLIAPMALAKDPPSYEKGKLLSMNSVKCGSEQSSAKNLASEIIGTDSGHSNTEDLLCQEYTIQTDRLVYLIRPKDTKHPALLPVGEMVDFRVHKDKLYLRAPESDDKEREYGVLSIEMRDGASSAKTAQ